MDLIAQIRPSGTAAVAAMTKNHPVEVTHIVIANTTGSPADASLYHDDDGKTYSQATALLYGKAVSANDVLTWELPIRVRAGGSLGIQTDTGSALTFSFYGTDLR